MRNYYRWLGLTYVITLATNPALALPCGMDERGMPFGLQVVGRLHADAQLLAASRALEQVFEASDTLHGLCPTSRPCRPPGRNSSPSSRTTPPMAADGARPRSV